jgi:serine/threonine protein kinase
LAVKSVWKYQFDTEEKISFLKQEIEILLILDHENIIKCYEVYEDNLSIHFVFDLIKGGDLLEHLMTAQDHILPENQAQEFLIQILDSIQYLHSINVVHRDIKPENFMISFSERGVRLMLIDFGFAAFSEENKKMFDIVGSQQYMAPEIIKTYKEGSEDGYDIKVDLWAVGIVMFNMITGRQPFNGSGDVLLDNILNGKIDWAGFKNQFAIELCSQLLERDPTKRISAAMAKMSIWVSSPENQQTVIKHFEPSSDTIKHINDFNMLSNLRDEIWTLCLTFLSNEDVDKAFTLLDNKLEAKQDNDGLNRENVITFELFVNTILSLKEVVPDMRIKLIGKY